jgi:MoaA/NifB/PqqE/SkfB family radical SAM enzyme
MNSKTFCIAPWAHSVVTPSGNMAPCCVWKGKSDYNYKEFDAWINSDDMRTLRQKLHSGTFVDSCNPCYSQEKYGRLSTRQVYNVEFSKFIDLKKLDTKDWKADSDDICTLDLKLGNLCNLKCVMCNGNYSSQLMTEYKQYKNKFDELGYSVQGVDKDFSWPLSSEFREFLSKFEENLKWIKFTGGEPTLIPYVFDFLSEVKHPSGITVSLITNGTTYNDQLFEVLKKFKTVWVTVSLEGIGNHNDMIRYNSEWDKVEHNILKYKKISNVRFVINHVLQAFSVKTFIPLLDWCENNDLKLIFTLLLGHPELSLNSVSTEEIEQFKCDLIKKQKDIKLNVDLIPGVLSILKDHRFDSSLEQSRLDYLKVLDNIRKTDLASII